jgi:hypothetical protein
MGAKPTPVKKSPGRPKKAAAAPVDLRQHAGPRDIRAGPARR